MKNLYKKLLVSIFLFFMFSSCSKAENQEKDMTIYFGLKAEDYLTGNFEPSIQKGFISLAKAGVPTDGRDQYLRVDAANALLSMINDFEKTHPGKKIFVVSSTRNFYSQKRIWEDKWNGVTKVGGKDLKKEIPDPDARSLEILKYSSLPGTSRHHWGTDVDLNSLLNSYFDKGDGKIVYDWLVVNASRFGFAQPYTAGRKNGYNEEKWHWSYVPVAKRFYRDWLEKFGNNAAELRARVKFDGQEAALKYSRIYVVSVNDECK